MSETTVKLAASPGRARAGRALRWGVPALGALAGAALAAALTGSPTDGGWRFAVVGDAGLGAVEWSAPELGREWRWAPKGVKVEFVFRRSEPEPLYWLASNRPEL